MYIYIKHTYIENDSKLARELYVFAILGTLRKMRIVLSPKTCIAHVKLYLSRHVSNFVHHLRRDRDEKIIVSTPKCALRTQF